MALDDLLDEHEQGERVQRWLRDNGIGIIGGVGLAIAIVGGWQWWQKQQLTTLHQAHQSYQVVSKHVRANNIDEAAIEAAALAQNSAGIYADLAALELAQAHVQAQRYEEAITTLQNITAKDRFSPLIEQRLARLLIETGKPDQALAVLNTLDDAASLEIRADAQFAQNQLHAARELYQQALTRLDSAAPQRRLLALKLMQVNAARDTANVSTALPVVDSANEAASTLTPENNG